MQMITELWATPILTKMVLNHEEITKELLRVHASEDYQKLPRQKNVMRFFKGSPVLENFCTMLEQEANYFVANYGMGNMIIQRTWFNTQINGEAKTPAGYPHVHHQNRVAAVYYMQVPIDSNNGLMMIDPRGGTNGWDEDNRIFQLIRPQNGMLVMMPGYLVHMTEENRSTQPRISFVVNLGEKY